MEWNILILIELLVGYTISTMHLLVHNLLEMFFFFQLINMFKCVRFEPTSIANNVAILIISLHVKLHLDSIHL